MVRLHRAGGSVGRLHLSLCDGLQDWNEDVSRGGTTEGSQDTNSQRGKIGMRTYLEEELQKARKTPTLREVWGCNNSFYYHNV